MDGVPSEAEAIASARWSAYNLDHALRVLAVLGFAAAIVVALSYLAPYAEELVGDA